MDIKSRIAEIEQSLTERGVSVARLCREADISQTSWVRWKNGSMVPKDETWERIESAYRQLTLIGVTERAA